MSHCIPTGGGKRAILTQTKTLMKEGNNTQKADMNHLEPEKKKQFLMDGNGDVQPCCM